MLLPVIAKDFNWEILTRIQLLEKDGIGLKMENSNIMQVCWKGGRKKKTIYTGELPKKGAWTPCRFKGGYLVKNRAMYYCIL